MREKLKRTKGKNVKRNKDKNDIRLFVGNDLSQRQWSKVFNVLKQKKLSTLNSIPVNLPKIKDFRHTRPKSIYHHQKCITKYFF